jgi:hypothetical protein
VQRLVFALVNEGAHILEEGIAARASDIDMVYITGYGFPIHRGGPMLYADQVGLFNVVQAMKRFQKNPRDDAKFWEPAPLLLKLAPKARPSADLAAPKTNDCVRQRGPVIPSCSNASSSGCAAAAGRRRGGQHLARARAAGRWPRRPLALDYAGGRRQAGGAIRFQTVSSLDDPAPTRPNSASCTPTWSSASRKVHAKLKREFVGGLSLLYTWQGSDPSAKPIALMAHQDVVPDRARHRRRWQVPPFAGR